MREKKYPEISTLLEVVSILYRIISVLSLDSFANII